jgi:hypothetical protein
MARASDARHSNVVSVDLESEILKGVWVTDGFAGVGLGESEDAGVLWRVAVVLDDALADAGDVQKAVQKVRGPVKVGSTVGNVVAEHAHAFEGTAEDVWGVTNYGLGGGVGSAPVTSPVCRYR